MFEFIGTLIAVLIGIGLLYMTYEGVKTNKLVMKGNNPGYITRDEYPILFWCFVVLYVVVGFALTVAGIILLFV
ncbi:MAG: DUF2542 family protein [Chloroflexota bacterium]